MSAAPDVVLVTVDCWRHDAVERMDSLRALTGAYVRTDAICPSAATPGVFPAIFASQYYPQVYTASGAVDPSVKTLPAVLGDHGYRTGAIVADNPFLDRFADAFDHFWNGPHGGESTVAKVARLARQRDTAPVTEVARRSEEWFTATEAPRFLFVHLMDPHEPYLPGLRRGLSEGMIDSYRILRKFARDRRSLSEDETRTVENLYWHCIDYLDDHVGDLLSFVPDDAVVAMLGDHGEEFAHGAYRHARLYDECVRVPLLTRNLSGVTADAAARQLDLAPTVLDELGIDVPDAWEGRPAAGDPRPSFMLNHSPHLGASYVGRRTSDAKLVRTYEGSIDDSVTTEFFDLEADPRETENLHGTGDRRSEVREFERAVDGFLDRPEVRGGIRRGTEPETEEVTGTDEHVEERLEALGYR